jgi:circadian clock protein KaiB
MTRRSPRRPGSPLRRGRTQAAKEKHVLVLYITGSSPLSLRAVRNLRSLCDDYLDGCHKLEIIDLYDHPELAEAANVIAAPTMVKTLPLPVQRFVGDMSDRESLLARMKIQA